MSNGSPSPPEPPKPVPAEVIDVKFRNLPEGTAVGNPTLLAAVPAEHRDPDRATKPLCGHGIRIERRHDDLDYILKDDTRHRIPRPPVGRRTQLEIESVSWAAEPRWQSAFTVRYMRKPGAAAGVFRVNIHGEGRLEPDLLGWDPDLRPEPFLRIRPTGLTYESDLPGAAGTAGLPRSPRIGKARRYHFRGSSLSLYVSRSGDRTLAALADDSDPSGSLAKSWVHLFDLAVDDSGTAFVTFLELKDKLPPREQTDELHLSDRRISSKTIKRLGDPPPGGSRQANLAELRALGVGVNERGARFSGFELHVALDLLKLSRLGPGVVRAIKAQQETEQRRHRKTDPSKDLPVKGPGLTLVKDVMATGGSYDDEKGEVIIPAWIRGKIEETPTAIRHELAHTLFQAVGGTLPGLPRPDDANQTEAPLPLDIAADMNNWVALAVNQRIIVGPIDLPLAPPPTFAGDLAERWRRRVGRMMSADHVLNQAFMNLHRRFSIDDPEQTGDIRGIDVADESRYMAPNARGEELGHGFDSVHEFVASFVVSSMQYQLAMVDTVRQSVAKDGPRLAELYAKVWDRVDQAILALPGPNPYRPLARASAASAQR